MSTMMPNYEAGQVVNIRPGWLALQREGSGWDGAQGIIDRVVTRYLPAIKVLWLSGPHEGRTITVPFYQIVPEGQEELLTMEVDDEGSEDTEDTETEEQAHSSYPYGGSLPDIP